MTAPLVSAIVLNYRATTQHIPQCIAALRQQTLANELEVLVVDNHSDDDSIGILRNRIPSSENIHIIEAPRNLGFGAGYNYGARYAQGQYLLILNPDTHPEPNALEQLIAVLRAEPDIGIIAPRLVFDDGTLRDSSAQFPTMLDHILRRTPGKKLWARRLQRYAQHDRDPHTKRDTDWVVGACMLMERSLYEQLGGFDERFFLFFEDTDICRRCWQLGQRVVYDPTVTAADQKQRLSGGTFAALFLKRTGRIHISSGLKYFWKWRHASGRAGAAVD